MVEGEKHLCKVTTAKLLNSTLLNNKKYLDKAITESKLPWNQRKSVLKLQDG